MLVALGTHAAMTDAQLAVHLGYADGRLAATYPGLTVLNHEWWNPDTFVSVGSISADRIEALSEGRLREGVEVVLNRAVVEHDVALVVGPVFPHEVVGFSGGNKYFFPGVAGPQVIDFSHWLGALISSAEIIGTRGDHPGTGVDQRGGGVDPQPAAGVVLGREVRQPRSARGLVRPAGGGLGRVCRRVRQDPRPLPGRPGAPGVVDHPDQV